MPDLPTGTVTFLFTDIAGSTRMWEQHPDVMRPSLARHAALLHSAIDAHAGHVFKTVGDAFCAAFQTAPDALEAALAAQRALAAEPWPEATPIRVRIGLHTGVADAGGGDYFGPTVNRVARLMSAGHGGQTLLSAAAWELVRDDLPEGVTLRDLGERRLKDLRRPERVFQVLSSDLPAEFPPLATLDARPNNLPVQLTSFVGREREMADVKRLLKSAHLVTLTGIGGTGKTRLALQAAAERLDDFEHGVWFVDLAPIVDSALVAQSVASAIRIHDTPGRTLGDALVEGLAAKRLLIILDNCEHLIVACAGLADRLLRSAAGLRILATSREALAVAGEATVAIAPLPAPPAAAGTDGPPMTATQLMQFDAVRLFIDRATAVKVDFAVTNANAPAVAGICERLDGIPLAIELAAARVRMMPPEAILERLTDRFRLLTSGSRTAPTRQQTLLAAVDWSHELLEPREQVLYRQLAAFRGGWTVEAAEAVCMPMGIEAEDVLELLGRLVDKSLVIAADDAGVARFRWLETVRQHARAKLQEAGELSAVIRCHAEHFVAWAEASTARFERENAGSTDWMTREADNLRAVLERTVDDPTLWPFAVRLAIAHPWDQGRFVEGESWCLRLLDERRDEMAPAEKAKLCLLAGSLGTLIGRHDEAIALLEAALPDLQALGDARLASHCLNGLGYIHMLQGRFDSARRYFVDNLATKPADAPDHDFGIGLNNLAELDWYCGDVEGARAGWAEALRRFQRSGAMNGFVWPSEADVFRGLGHLARLDGDPAGARVLYGRGLAIARDHGAPIESMRMLICLAALAAASSEPLRAARLCGAAEDCRDRKGLAFEPMDRVSFDDAVTNARSAVGDAAWFAAVMEGRAMGLDAAVEEAMAFAMGGAEHGSRDEPPGASK